MSTPRSLVATLLRLLLVAGALVVVPACHLVAEEADTAALGDLPEAPSAGANVLAYDRATGFFEPALLADLAPPAELLHDGQLWRLTADGPVLVGPAQPAELAEANATYDAARPARAPARAEWVLVTTPAGEVLEHRRLRDVVPGSTIAFQGRLYDTRGSPEEGVTAVRATGDVYGRVVHTFVRQASEVIDAVVAYADGTEDLLTGTPNHPFWVSALDAYVPLSDLEVGARLHVQGGGEAILVSKTWRQGDFEVFDIEVEGLHSFYVRGSGSDAAGVLVHNSSSNSLFKRASWRKSTETSAESASRAANDGDLLCATCGKDVSGKVTVDTKNGPVERRGYDLDHFPDTWAERVDEMKGRPEAPTRKEVLDEHNRDVRVQCPECNQGHQYEGVPGDYQ